MFLKVTKFEKLEKRRSIFLEIGMILSLLLALCAFNWKSYDKEFVQTYYRAADHTPVEMAPVTQQKPPELKPPSRPPVVHTINIVDDEVLVDEDYTINAEVDPLDSVTIYIAMPALRDEEAQADEKEIFRVVESMPEFPGGEPALYKFLSENVSYPETAKAAGISGKVYITFVVEKDGSITDVKLLRGIGGGCDQEALKAVNKMPRWKPGLQRNHTVRVQFVIDIKFTLEGM